MEKITLEIILRPLQGKRLQKGTVHWAPSPQPAAWGSWWDALSQPLRSLVWSNDCGLARGTRAEMTCSIPRPGHMDTSHRSLHFGSHSDLRPTSTVTHGRWKEEQQGTRVPQSLSGGKPPINQAYQWARNELVSNVSCYKLGGEEVILAADIMLTK